MRRWAERRNPARGMANANTTMSNKITPQQFETLEHIANRINAEIAAYNDTNDIVHQVIAVAAYSNDDEDGHNAYFEITTFRTHSAAEETLRYNVVSEIGKKLVAAGIPDVIAHSVDSTDGMTFTASYTINTPTTNTEIIMNYKLIIKCENAAFGEDDGTARRFEIARILRETADALEEGQEYKTLRDVNGNRVGIAELIA